MLRTFYANIAYKKINYFQHGLHLCNLKKYIFELLHFLLNRKLFLQRSIELFSRRYIILHRAVEREHESF